MNLYAQETFLNATEGHMIGENDVYETYCETRGELFRAMRDEYGRCTGRVYIDTEAGTKAVGWVFQGRDTYEDTGESYLREVWVTVHNAPPTRKTESHYHTWSAS